LLSQIPAKVTQCGKYMLSILSHAIHDDVRNNEEQELNLSALFPTLPIQRARENA